MTKQTFMKVWEFLLSSLTTGGKLKINYILGRNQLIILFGRNPFLSAFDMYIHK